MGNVCLSRDEYPDEDFEDYKKYKKLLEEVSSTLGNAERFSAECVQSYRAACDTKKVKVLNKTLMREMTTTFLKKLDCDDDPAMVNKIHMSLNRQFPNGEEE